MTQPPSYIYNRRTQTVHKWPGCRQSTTMKVQEYWTADEFQKATQERGAIHRCRSCWPIR